MKDNVLVILKDGRKVEVEFDFSIGSCSFPYTNEEGWESKRAVYFTTHNMEELETYLRKTFGDLFQEMVR